MSENWLRLIPTDPRWVPDRGGDARGREVLRMLAPGADEVTTTEYDDIRVVDCGANFEGIFCPSCAAELSYSRWQDAMGSAERTAFVNLELTMPCCGATTNLNDLRYAWPMGFARWLLSASSPGRMELSGDEVGELERAVGHPLREIWAHY